MIKITAIIGSCIKDDIYKVVRQIEQKIREQADVQFEYIFLKDEKLEENNGCFACITEGEKRCPPKGGFSAIGKRLTN